MTKLECIFSQGCFSLVLIMRRFVKCNKVISASFVVSFAIIALYIDYSGVL